jgi:plasmid stabilization system protein ParE
MKYRVLWTPNADEQFDAILQAAVDRVPLAAAARVIDRWLATDPAELGESREYGVRIAFNYPLAVEFEVLEDVKTVVVYEVGAPTREADMPALTPLDP